MTWSRHTDLTRTPAVLLPVLLAVLTLALGACGKRAPAPTAGEAVSADRIVAFSPAVAVMLRDLGLADRIVGKHDYDLVLGETVPAVGHQEAIDYERLLEANPTHVVIEWGSRPLPPTLTELAERHDWAIMRVNLLTIDDIARTVDDIALTFGAVTMDTGSRRKPDGVPSDLSELSGAMAFTHPAERFETDLPSAALARAWSRRGPDADGGFGGAGPVLLLGSTTPPGALGPGSFHHQILVRIGGVSVYEPVEGAPWMELDAEDVRRLDPAGIVLIAPRTEEREGAVGDTTVRPAMDRLGRIGTLDIRAVREGKIALIDDPLALLPSTSMADFADRLAEILGAWSGQKPSP